MRYGIIVVGIFLVMPSIAKADLGIMDTVSETNAKTGASSLGITQVYDHPGDVPNGQYVVPVAYNRTAAEGNGIETQAGDPKANDVDYVPLSQLKGATGAAGAVGASGAAGVAGAVGTAGINGQTGANGAQGLQGLKGDKGDTGKNLEAPAIDPRLDVEIREFDSQHWTTSSFASFGMQTTTARYIVGQRLTLKLGQSYEEKQRHLLEKRMQKMLRDSILLGE